MILLAQIVLFAVCFTLVVSGITESYRKGAAWDKWVLYESMADERGYNIFNERGSMTTEGVAALMTLSGFGYMMFRLMLIF